MKNEQTKESPNHRGPEGTDFLSRSDVASLFGVSLSTVTRWARTGLIQAVRTPGGHYRYLAANLRLLPPVPAAAEKTK